MISAWKSLNRFSRKGPFAGTYGVHCEECGVNSPNHLDFCVLNDGRASSWQVNDALCSDWHLRVRSGLQVARSLAYRADSRYGTLRIP